MAGRGLFAVRMWSANTWIIVACVVIFVVDGFLPPHWVRMGLVVENKEILGRDHSALVVGDQVRTVVSDPRTRRPLIGVQPVYVNTPAGPVRVAHYVTQWMHPLEAALHFSTQRGFFEVQFWRFVGFQFLHSHDMPMHIVFNMIMLFFFGPLVERYLGSKRYVAFYLLCGIFGALMYTLLNVGGYVATEVFGVTSPVPFLLFNDFSTPLVGASAGVFGVVIAGALLVPNATVLLFFLIPMRLRTLAFLLIGIAVFTLFTRGSNAGGEAGHLGGAIAGWYFIRHPHHLHGFFDVLGWLDPTSHHYRHRRVAGPGGARGRAVERASRRRGGPSRPEVDRVLDKVHAEGLASLTDHEKRILREASERGR